MRLRFPILAALPLAFGMGSAVADQPVLTVYTYNSFVSEWGPGPAIQPEFEKQCGCKIEWVALEDGAALLSRLKLEGDSTPADVVLGLDNNLTAEAAETGLFDKHGADLSKVQLPIDWSDPHFVPFDYGYFAFIYDSQTLKTPPQSLADITAESKDPKVILMDPRTSTPGLGLLLWIKQVYGDQADQHFTGLAKHTLTVTKGWSEGYGLFLKGEAPLVLSYTTSPAYHQLVENTDRYKAAYFPEGHYLQIEVAGRIKGSKNSELAKQFLNFVVSKAFQAKVPTTNWMYPVIDLGSDLPEIFRTLPKPEKTLVMPDQEVAQHRAAWIEEWLNSASQ